MNLEVRKQLTCSERYSCIQACKSCFFPKKKQNLTNVITLDGIQFFPKEFIDFKQLNSSKVQNMGDEEEEDEEE